ncbi:MAG TPA: GMC family oxidoreductase N-terminal domain-containing protein, partial [Pseudomonadales bacterium]|nr:GMC family oxidoreductase N-terminal domain-containing protein [Pseudomonadales bacterium]
MRLINLSRIFSSCVLGGVVAFSVPVFADNETYDYIVVGSGAGGGPLAARLAERGFSVLLLEAGDLKQDDMDYTQIPALHPLASEREGLSWQYMVEHYTDPNRETLDSKRCPKKADCVAKDGTPLQGVFYPRGSTVGGSSAVNAMISLVPHDSDWNNIATITGDSSWKAPAMREYFIKIERNENGSTSSSGHGTSGWLSVNQNALTITVPGQTPQLSLPLDVTASYVSVLAGMSSASESYGSY